MGKYMRFQKQWKLRKGDIVVMEGIDRPGIVVRVDKEGSDKPTQVRFPENGGVGERLPWAHPPIIRRYPRVGEQVVIKRLTDKDSHGWEVGHVSTVIQIDFPSVEDAGQELLCRDTEGMQQWVYEAGVKRIKKGKAGT